MTHFNFKHVDKYQKKTLFGFVIWVIVMILATAALFAITTPANAQTPTNVPVAKQQHYLYQVQDGHVKQVTIHRDRYTCIKTAGKIKLKSGTWYCEPY